MKVLMSCLVFWSCKFFFKETAVYAVHWSRRRKKEEGKKTKKCDLTVLQDRNFRGEHKTCHTTKALVLRNKVWLCVTKHLDFLCITLGR